MRIKKIIIAEQIKFDGPCEWPGCRDKAQHLISYQVRTGRVQAGLWQPRTKKVCTTHLEEFKQKYMTNLCPKCNACPIDENATTVFCEDCQSG